MSGGGQPDCGGGTVVAVPKPNAGTGNIHRPPGPSQVGRVHQEQLAVSGQVRHQATWSRTLHGPDRGGIEQPPHDTRYLPDEADSTDGPPRWFRWAIPHFRRIRPHIPSRQKGNRIRRHDLPWRRTNEEMEESRHILTPAVPSSGPITRPTNAPQLYVMSPTPSPEPEEIPRPAINTNSLRIPHEERQPKTKPQPQFRLHDISTLQPEHAVELAAPASPPYKIAACPVATGRRRASKPSRPGSSTCARLHVTVVKGSKSRSALNDRDGSSVLEDNNDRLCRIRLDASTPPAKTVYC
ncbi:unnamed protein product [Anisakis simplex]|uniref:Uncharacterized protein n=1 Tax=Anisakis simplex TaxID=6269 RepID=A0A0M3K928_ANISI|nr:unnamed protein product [Anisakis simplex]